MATGFRSKKEIVYELLREDILNGTYEPNSRLIIDDLASKLHVSQIPIREAVQQLEADGFVTIEPNVGARIAELDATFIFEVFALLESMEVICGRKACVSMTDEEMDKLAKMVADMDVTVADGITVESAEQWSEQNRVMHLFICECANTRLVSKMLQKVFDHWTRLRRFYFHDISGNRINEANAEHKQLLEALRERDPDQVEEIIHIHNESALKSYIKHLEAVGHLDPVES